MSLIKTKMIAYKFDISKGVEESQKYHAMCDKLKGVEKWEVDSRFTSYDKQKAFRDKIKTQFIQIDTKCLFSNQWNTVDKNGGLRVFQWWEMKFPNKDIKEGYYLELPEELKQLMKDTFACGYCGKQYYKPMVIFCKACLDSEYLEKKDLFLLKLLPISDNREKRNPLSKAEKLGLEKLYIDSQIHGRTERGIKRIKAKRKSLLRDRDKDIYSANTKYNGFIWLMDNGINVDNCIYYSHTDIFSFGWRHKVCKEVASELKIKLTKFNFNYEIKE